MIETQTELTAISPVDGRYRSQLPDSKNFISEFALIHHRLRVEVEYLIFLADQGLIPNLTVDQKNWLRQLVADFSLEQAQDIKAIEAKTHHDVKAIEYWLRDQLVKQEIAQEQFVHLALTSEDTNSMAYSLLLKEIQTGHLVPSLQKLLKKLTEVAEATADQPMLARTHGQPAVPTTLGKEVANFAMRLLPEVQALENHTFKAKLTGAVGNFNAQVVMLQKTNWLEFSPAFLQRLDLEAELFTTQILPAENYTHFFQILQRVNMILIDLSQDFWRYISDGYLSQKLTTGQVGSSTMPHKVNPIDFENSEGNLGVANALLAHFVTKLPVSRLQRDLSDSTVKRHVGTALATCLLAYQSLSKGLGKISADDKKLRSELQQHPEVLAEAFQVILRFHGISDGYEKVQNSTQGKAVTIPDLHDLVDGLELPIAIKHKLKNLTPEKYVGLATELTHQAVTTITNYLQGKHDSSQS